MFQYTSRFRGRSVPPIHRFLYIFRAVATSYNLIFAMKALKGTQPINSKRVVRFMNDLSNGTNGRGLDWINLIVARLRRADTIQFDLIKSVIQTENGFSVDASQYLDMISTLKIDGAVKVNEFLSKSDSEDLYHRLRLISGHTKCGTRTWRSLDQWLKSSEKSLRFDTDYNLIYNIPIIQQIASNALLLKISRDYLGAPPIVSDIQSWTTTFVGEPSDQDIEDAAMAFHCDADYVKFLKVFLLLTDVNGGGGPFQFVLKSHRGSRHTAGRMPDSEILLPCDELFHGTGRAGDILIVDTRGWHKATPVSSGHRTMVQFIFTSSLFGGQVA